MHVDLSDWRPWLADAALLLDAAECERTSRLRRIEDREARILTYGLHRLLLGAVLGLDAAAVPLGRDDRGCPRLAGGDVETSLSHADGYAAMAISRHGPVGIDLEVATRAGVLPEIAARVCHPDETGAFAALDPPTRAAALLALWVRKEALLKAAGVGLAREMTTFVAPADAALLWPSAGEGFACIQMLDAGPGLVAAVAHAQGLATESLRLRPRGRSALDTRGRGTPDPGLPSGGLMARGSPLG